MYKVTQKKSFADIVAQILMIKEPYSKTEPKARQCKNTLQIRGKNMYLVKLQTTKQLGKTK